MSKAVRDVVVAIDIGTTKICVLIASVDSAGALEIVGIGRAHSQGLKKGIIVSIGAAVDSIRCAVDEAEAMAGLKIKSASVGISGDHIDSFNSKGVVPIRRKDVSQHDIDRVIEAAKAVAVPRDREILHVIPQYFKVDNQEVVQDSLGMSGVRLEAQVHIITGGAWSAQNIIKSCQYAGVQVNDILLEPLASACAVLTRSEQELGVGLLDIGGGTSDFAVYKQGRVRYSKILSVAGNHFTNDLAIGCGIPISEAENLKRSYGFVDRQESLLLRRQKVDVNMGIEFQGAAKIVDTNCLFDFLYPRAEEILHLVLLQIQSNRLQHCMPAGLVLTGGGALLRGLQGLAQKKLGIPVRIGIPCYEKVKSGNKKIVDLLKNPMHATAYGLLLYALDNKSYLVDSLQEGHLHGELLGREPVFVRVVRRMKSWIYDFMEE